MVTVSLFARLVAKPGKEEEVAARLMARAPTLLAAPPTIERLGVLGAKLPG